MDLGLQGRRALVAGATAGLGLASAAALAEAGAQVVICGRDPDRLASAVASLQGLAGPVTGIRADVGTVEGATELVSAGIDRLGGIDILVPNAGGPPPGTFSTTPVEAYTAALQLNLLSTVAMCKAAVPSMVTAGWGRVVAITSISVRQPIDALILSNTARAGVTGFLKTLATEVAASGVTVNSVLPGSHATDRLRAVYGGDLSGATASVPTRVLGRPADFGQVVAFLCSDHARFITGVALPVDGGANRALF